MKTLFMNKLFLVLIILTVSAASYYFFVRRDVPNPNGIIVSNNTVHSGIEVRNYTAQIEKQNVNINLLIINLKNSGLRIRISSPHIFNGKDRSSYSGFSLSEYMRLGAYEVVQSGGFMSSFLPPKSLGYLKIGNREYNNIHNSWLTTGVFCTNGKDYDIFRYENKDQFEKWTSCLQAGPILIKDNVIVLDKSRKTGYIAKENHRQSFLCELQDKRLVMGIAENVRLDWLVTYLSRLKVDGSVGCVDAVALNGKNIAGLLYKTKSGISKFGNSDAPLPNSIAIE